MTEDARPSPLSVQEAKVVRVSGDLGLDTLARVAEPLRLATSALSPPALLVLDLRELVLLTVAGSRLLQELARSCTERGVRYHVVVEPDSAVARVVAATDPAGTLPRFGSLEQALTAQGTVPGRTPGALMDQLETLTRTLVSATTAGAALGQIVEATTAVISRAAMVSVTLRTGNGEFSTPVRTDPVAERLDQIQYHSGNGPCMDAARPEEPGYVMSEDLGEEYRWLEFAAAAVGYGYHAVLSTELFTPHGPGRISGALNVYAREPGAFGTVDRHAALLLATHASLALAYSQAVEASDLHEAQLRRAIDTRDVIGQTKGILMNRQGITADEAFALLRQTSQDLNVKLVDLARTISDNHGRLDLPAQRE